MITTNTGVHLDATISLAIIRCVIASVSPHEGSYPVAILRFADPSAAGYLLRGVTSVQEDDGRYLHTYQLGARIPAPSDEVVWLHCPAHTTGDSPTYLQQTISGKDLALAAAEQRYTAAALHAAAIEGGTA